MDGLSENAKNNSISIQQEDHLNKLIKLEMKSYFLEIKKAIKIHHNHYKYPQRIEIKVM
jgi:hypothetical protein